MPWKKAEAPLQDQFAEACEKIRRQLEIIGGPSSWGRWGDVQALKERLKAALAELEQIHAELDSRS